MSSGGGRGAQVKSLMLVNVLACRLFIWQRHPSPWRGAKAASDPGISTRLVQIDVAAKHQYPW